MLAVVEQPGARLVLLTGEAGVGKSYLLEHLASRVGADRAWGVAALAGVPGSGLAHLVQPADTLPELIRAVLVKVGPRLCVDDLDLCDPLSLALVERLLREPDRLVIATVRTRNGELPSSLRDLAREPWTRVVEVAGFSREDLDGFAVAELGGPVDAGLGEQLWRRTAGNPLYAAQVLRAGLACGAVAQRGGVWHAVTMLPVPDSLLDAVTDQVTALGPAAKEAAQWLAGVGEVPAERVTRSGRGDAVRQLMDAGIVLVTERPDPAGPSRRSVVFAHPLFAEAVWAATDGLRREAVLREHVEAERSSPRPDVLRLAVLGLDVGEPVAPDALLAAARLAVGGAGSAGVESALRLARAALPGATGELRAEATALTADALMQLGRAGEAVELLEHELAAMRPGPHAILLAGLLHIVLTWGLGDEPAASAMLARQAKRYPRWTPVVREVFGFVQADGLTYAGRPAQALALTEGLKVGGGWRILGKLTPLGKLLPQVEARITQSRAHALTQLARPAEAAALLTGGRTSARLAELEELIPSWRGNYYLILSHATREAGDPRAALEHANSAYAATLDTGFVWGRAWATCNIAAAWLQIGDLAQAATWARRTIDTARVGHLADAERLAISLLSTAEGSQGRPPAPTCTDRLDVLPSGVGFLWHHHPVGAAWRAYSAGRTSLAEAAIIEGLEAAERDGAAGAALALCHEWLRLGRPVALAGRMRDLVKDAPQAATGRLCAARLALARGVEEQDPALLVEASELFAGHGMPLFAAEAAALAALRSSGREATALRRRAAALAETVGSPTTPLLALSQDGGGPDPLTRRERLIAELATTMSNVEIAAQQHISVRTVEGHLSHIYVKLGITGRNDLAAALSGRSGRGRSGQGRSENR
ncbi:MAG: LuxR C-terminal-related transcriptional regulator [Motilibacteraceae bacterium]